MAAKRKARGESVNMWTRAIWIDQRIRDGNFPSKDDIQEHFDCHPTTVKNTVAFMRYSLGAPLVYRKKPRELYRYSEDTYALPTAILREGEFLALLLSEQILHHYVGTPLEDALKQAVGKLTRYLPEQIKVRAQEISDTIRFAGLPPRDVSLPLMADLERAIRECRKIRIVYHTYRTDEVNERVVEPHFLAHTQSGWQLVAWDHLRNADRNFVPSRIRECEVLNEKFVRRPELDPAVYTRHGLFSELSSNRIPVTLRFTPHQAKYMRERTWHESQQIEDLPDGGLILRLEIAGKGDVARWVQSYGRHVEVLEPDWLRREIHEEALAVAAIYEPPDMK